MKALTVPAERGSLSQVQAFLEAELESAGCSPRAQTQLQIAAEEIFINIASYAYAPGSGEAVVEVSCADGVLTLTFIDAGSPFDPTAASDADTSPDALMSRTGGLGILMARRMTDGMTYARTDGKNVLTIRKLLK